MRGICIAFVLLGLFTPSVGMAAQAQSAQNMRKVDWHPPAGGVVRDSMTAIAIARVVWISLNGVGGSESEWQAEMVATLDNGVWTVKSNDQSDGVGGCIFILIAQSDARVLDMFATQ